MAIAFGAFLNAIGILLGALLGLSVRKPLPARAQSFFRSTLGLATLIFAFFLVWLSINGTVWSCTKQFVTALVAVVIGHAVGRLMKVQKFSNRIGHHAAVIIGNVQKNGLRNPADGFNACTILLCAAPLGIVGAITDGLTGYFWLLAVKAVMDGLALVSLVKLFRWPAAMSAFPVFLFLGLITVGCRLYVAPFLDAHGLTASVNAAAGFISCAVAVVVFETRKVELANYLPALLVAPALTWVLRVI